MRRGGTIEIPSTSIPLLQNDFAEQLRTQGWEADHSAFGISSASSVWFKTASTPETADQASEELELTGILAVIHEAGDDYHVTFQLQGKSEGVLVPSLGIRGIPPNSRERGFSGIPPSP